jgi:hypothetical protein
MSLEVPGKKKSPSRFPSRVLTEKAVRFQNLIYISLGFPSKQDLLIQQNLAFRSKPTVKQHPLRGPPQGSLLRKRSVSRAIGLFTHSYLSDPPVKELSHETGENLRSLSTEHQVDRRPIYSGVRSGSSRGSFTTPLLLHQA